MFRYLRVNVLARDNTTIGRRYYRSSNRWASRATAWPRPLGVQQRRIDEICAGVRGVTAETAVRLGLAFDIDPQFWLNLQAQYDIEVIQRDQSAQLAEEVHPLAA